MRPSGGHDVAPGTGRALAWPKSMWVSSELSGGILSFLSSLTICSLTIMTYCVLAHEAAQFLIREIAEAQRLPTIRAFPGCAKPQVSRFPTHGECVTIFNALSLHHFPTQNRLKISSSKSGVMSSPVTCPSALTETRMSSQISSS